MFDMHLSSVFYLYIACGDKDACIVFYNKRSELCFYSTAAPCLLHMGQDKRWPTQVAHQVAYQVAHKVAHHKKT